jgi:hypothetical protein
MRYLRSWLFDIGLVLIIAAPASAAYFSSSRSYEISEPEAMIRASYIDIDMRLPIGPAVSGLSAVTAAIWRIRRGFN